MSHRQQDWPSSDFHRVAVDEKTGQNAELRQPTKCRGASVEGKIPFRFVLSGLRRLTRFVRRSHRIAGQDDDRKDAEDRAAGDLQAVQPGNDE